MVLLCKERKVKLYHYITKGNSALRDGILSFAQNPSADLHYYYKRTGGETTHTGVVQWLESCFEGNDEIKAIHVNVYNSSYGWNVTFDNGLSMNLRDLREYQTRFGKMPSPNGVISYGQTKLTFSNVERIVVYESAQYYFYS